MTFIEIIKAAEESGYQLRLVPDYNFYYKNQNSIQFNLSNYSRDIQSNSIILRLLNGYDLEVKKGYEGGWLKLYSYQVRLGSFGQVTNYLRPVGNTKSYKGLRKIIRNLVGHKNIKDYILKSPIIIEDRFEYQLEFSNMSQIQLENLKIIEISDNPNNFRINKGVIWYQINAVEYLEILKTGDNISLFREIKLNQLLKIDI